MSNVFDLFNLVDENENKRKEQEAEEKAKKEAEQLKQREALQAKLHSTKKDNSDDSKKNQKSNESKKTEELQLNEDTKIRYYGEEYDITTYFTTEELAEGITVQKKDKETKDDTAERRKINKEDIRKRIEKDFPELVKNHTEIIFLESKNLIVPQMMAKKKGNYQVDEVHTSQDVCTLNHHGKIPFYLLSQFIALAQTMAENHLEVHGDIYYDITNKKYLLDIPKQVVHRFWVNPIDDSLKTLERVGIDSVKVSEIHSHHILKPIPSNQDNQSERIPGMIYVIIGDLEDEWPEIFIRTFINETKGWRTLKYKDVFTSPFEDFPCFDIDNLIMMED